MPTWHHAWTLGPLLAVVALGTTIALQAVVSLLAVGAEPSYLD
jgi:hypothetical protein